MSNIEIHAPIFHKLETFFQELSKFELKLKEHKKPFPKFNTSKLALFYVSLGNAIKKNNLSLIPRNEFNVWRAAGIKHLEVQNCNVLAAIFHADINEGFGRELLANLCMLYGKPEIVESLRNGMPYKTSTEYAFSKSDDDARRIDIDIRGEDFIIFIEVKINHKEHETQLNDYADEIKALNKNTDKTLLLFLTQTGKPSSHYNKEKPSCPISWNYLLYQIDKLRNVKPIKDLYFSRALDDYIKNARKYFA